MAEPAHRQRLNAQQTAQVEEFLAVHGAEAFELAMRAGSLFGPDLRAGSKWALSSALGAYENGIATTLVTRLRSKAKNVQDRVDHQLCPGNVQLTLAFPEG